MDKPEVFVVCDIIVRMGASVFAVAEIADDMKRRGDVLGAGSGGGAGVPSSALTVVPTSFAASASRAAAASPSLPLPRPLPLPLPLPRCDGAIAEFDVMNRRRDVLLEVRRRRGVLLEVR